MKLQWPNRSVSIFFIVTFLVAAVQLINRVYLPLQVDERSLPEFTTQLPQTNAEVDASLAAMLAKFAAPPVAEGNTAPVQFDGRKLGSHYVSLLGIYKTSGVYKAILSLQPDSTAEKQLLRLSEQEEFSGLRLTEVKARSITIEFEKQSVTLQLFRSNQQSSVLTN